MIRSYNSYKKIENGWYKEVPEHWTVGRLNYYTEIFGGSTPKSSNDAYWNGSINWVTTDDLGKLNGKLIKDTRRTITEEGLANCSASLLPKNSVIISSRAPIGHLGILEINAATNQGCKGLVPLENKIDSRYLYYYLLAAKVDLQSLGSGSTFMEISSSLLKSYNIVVPSILEQIKIAAYLDHQTGLIDDIIEKKQQLIEKLKEQRQAIINEAVTKGLNPDAPMKNSGVEWIGEIPTDWTVSQYKFEAYVQNGFAFKSSLFDKNEGFPILRIRDITKGYTSTYYKGEYEDDYIVRKDDLLIGMDGDYNIRWWENGDVLLNQRCCRIIENENVSRRFLYYTLPFNLQIINDLTYYTTVKHLSSGDIYNARFPLPSFEEQTKIAEHLDHQTKLIDTIITKKQNQIDKLRHFCQSIISEAVTGKIDVREWEPILKESV
ncbi:restriction endonuclease subunit S [Zunongwangia endophytica]|uniref:Restriction endonuclease subunit S n=1 Tax=Zunongwangia endophytica TaxID=1808945 RepID=A0ABV8HD64_9FLAO|nr:restriction endonuclease subunit S [Zunongwangia endophytica]MDN3594648.1 restriction endonuclease subunit S [Zunongwangia endophytica]